MVNSRRKVQGVSKEYVITKSSTSIPYFRGLTDHLQHTETMRLESGTGSIDHEVSIFLLGGENKEKTNTSSPLNKFDIKRYGEIFK